MMAPMPATWDAPAPASVEKVHDLHDQAQRPRPPAPWRAAFGRYLGWPTLGLVCALGMVALGFQTRASWESHRDWVVPVTVPLLALGGLALAYLVWRRQWLALGPGATLLLAVLALTAANIWRGAATDGDDTARDVMSILAGVGLGLTVAALFGGLVWAESHYPTRVTTTPA